MSKHDHSIPANVAAKYWNGFITRTEAQQVFEEQKNVIRQLSIAVGSMDMICQCLAEKFGVSNEDIQTWCKAEAEKRMAAAKAAQQAGNVAPPTTQGEPDGEKKIILEN
jgi:hypothetical protein